MSIKVEMWWFDPRCLSFNWLAVLFIAVTYTGSPSKRLIPTVFHHVSMHKYHITTRNFQTKIITWILLSLIHIWILS